VDLYRNRKRWRAVQRAGMKKDFSWDASAAEYARVYERARNGPAVA
jgi:glycogen synthase